MFITAAVAACVVAPHHAGRPYRSAQVHPPAGSGVQQQASPCHCCQGLQSREPKPAQKQVPDGGQTPLGDTAIGLACTPVGRWGFDPPAPLTDPAGTVTIVANAATAQQSCCSGGAANPFGGLKSSALPTAVWHRRSVDPPAPSWARLALWLWWPLQPLHRSEVSSRLGGRSRESCLLSCGASWEGSYFAPLPPAFIHPGPAGTVA